MASTGSKQKPKRKSTVIVKRKQQVKPNSKKTKK
mgnify:CR=1 FL=1